ncbi:hypothetical protein [Vreelandella rituensis]|uniref:hypothetical protein n=1 Tax=Vreelandella rituensis TaxID=2282306 RepID=UPI001C6A8167|nr:hypothetical protein [Halomonas rituensis]
MLYQIMGLGAALLAKLGQDKEPLHQALKATDQLLVCTGNPVNSFETNALEGYCHEDSASTDLT